MTNYKPKGDSYTYTDSLGNEHFDFERFFAVRKAKEVRKKRIDSVKWYAFGLARNRRIHFGKWVASSAKAIKVKLGFCLDFLSRRFEERAGRDYWSFPLCGTHDVRKHDKGKQKQSHTQKKDSP
jgi:hypothetical protein